MAAPEPFTQVLEQALVLDRLRAFVVRRVEPSAAADVLQDIWIRLQRGAANVRDRERFTGWMYRVARSAIADHREDRRRHAPAPSETTDVEAPAAEADDDALVLACARSVRGIVEQLPAKYRDVLMLTELEQLSYVEVGARLGISLAAVKSRVLRGRIKLRAAFERCCRVVLDRRGTLIACERRSACASRPC
ncbi:sigma-70 family RNA polymerase sigma factor [Pendulispora brunnea]|uniref:Sigma-70 family RNA polymerase sigma factor n=1 Tax=Pendulispora brunnea TaxID=2905690 RepID=A0ABZ2JVY5_9BACT